MKHNSQKPVIIGGAPGTHLQLVAVVFTSWGKPPAVLLPYPHPSGTACKIQPLPKSPRFCCAEWVFLICSEDLPDCHKQCGSASQAKTYSQGVFLEPLQYFWSVTPPVSPPPLKAFPFGPHVRKHLRLHLSSTISSADKWTATRSAALYQRSHPKAALQMATEEASWC